MNFLIQQLGSVRMTAEASGLMFRSSSSEQILSSRQGWPKDVLASGRAWRTALDIEQLLECGAASVYEDGVLVCYEDFALVRELGFETTSVWTQPSPFLLRIGRKGDLARPDFRYRYDFLLGGRPVHVDRVGYYCKRAGDDKIYHLDDQAYALVEAMDAFNSLRPEDRTSQASWLAFSKIKGCARQVGAELDATLARNEVVIPSTIGLDVWEDENGALSFLPRCPELDGEEFHAVFERNAGAEPIYNIDRPNQGRVRVVLTETQHDVLRRMKRVRKVVGERKESLKRNPYQVFDGIAAELEFPGETSEPDAQPPQPSEMLDGIQYSDRVTGIGNYVFTPIPRAQIDSGAMSGLWRQGSLGGTTHPEIGATQTTSVEEAESVENRTSPAPEVSTAVAPPPVEAVPDTTIANSSADESEVHPEAFEGLRKSPREQKVILIRTNEDQVETNDLEKASAAGRLKDSAAFERPAALSAETSLRPHQEAGIHWLQTCARIADRKGVLLADDMGLGKTLQILSFLAWCIESGRFPDLSRSQPPFRPILIVAPLILVDTKTWEREMRAFFEREGVVFWPIVTLHGGQLAAFRRGGTGGAETELGEPVLDLTKIRQHRVVITNYETAKNYQHSFACFQEGKPIWSLVVADEAQEFKVPSTRISHAMKAIESDFRIACTGTPVETRLLDLWNICDTIQPGLLLSAREFTRDYENRLSGQEREESLGHLKQRLLFQRPHSFLLRRNKSEIAELPGKHVVKLGVVMSEEEITAHQSLLREMGRTQEKARYLRILARFALLYQHPALLNGSVDDLDAKALIAGSSKLRGCLEKLREIRDRGEKVIVFARHRDVQALLAKVLEAEFRLSVRIVNGETKSRASMNGRGSGTKTRDDILREFKAKPGFNVLILSPFVAGIGLTIVEANHVFHYGRWWNPAVESQATDRAYRIGQTKDVSVYLPIAHDPSGRIPSTFDERLDIIMEKRMRLAEDFLRPLADEDEAAADLYEQLKHEAAPGAGQ
jgi:hypothetical protein